MAARDVTLMQGNILQSAVVSLLAGGLLAVFKPNPETITRLMKGLFVGCGKRVVNGLAIYGCCSGIDFLRRSGFKFWFFDNKIGSDACSDEYFMSSSFRFVTFAASSGASCITNYVTRIIGLEGSRKSAATANVDGTIHQIETVEKKESTGLTGYLSRVVQFYDTEGKLKSYTNLARMTVHAGVFGISTVLTGAGLLPVTLGPIDNDTHVRVLRKCGPRELAYWSTLSALSTLAAETVWNSAFYALHLGENMVLENEDGTAAGSLGFTIAATVFIGVAAAALNGVSVFVVSDRAVCVLGEEGEAQGEGIIHTICKVLNDKVFTKIFDQRKGTAYIWARCIGYVTHVITN